MSSLSTPPPFNEDETLTALFGLGILFGLVVTFLLYQL
jgi:hypothetical protein